MAELMSDPIREALEAAKKFFALEIKCLAPHKTCERDYVVAHLEKVTAAIALLDNPHPDTERLTWLIAELNEHYRSWGDLFGMVDAEGEVDRAAIDQARGAA